MTLVTFTFFQMSEIMLVELRFELKTLDRLCYQESAGILILQYAYIFELQFKLFPKYNTSAAGDFLKYLS